MLSTFIDLTAVVISLSLLLKGIYEYTKAQRWKRAEFVSKEIKEFFSDADVRRALIMLDWNRNVIELLPNEIEGKTKLAFEDSLLESALGTHKEGRTFSFEDAVIKKIFDNFFDKLIIFSNYIKAGLITVPDIRPYLSYWIEILSDDNNGRKNEALRKQIWKYIHEYGYVEVKQLCEAFGFKEK